MTQPVRKEKARLLTDPQEDYVIVVVCSEDKICQVLHFTVYNKMMLLQE